MAKLPFDREEKSISSMFPGEALYTVPWAMVVDYDRKLWLRGDYTVSEEPGGTVQMLVVRVKDKYSVTVPNDYEYSLKNVHGYDDLIEVHEAFWTGPNYHSCRHEEEKP